MEPYERVMSAINHQSVDRCPIDYIATPEAHASLKRYLKIDDDEALLRRLGVDIRYIGPRFIGPKDMIGAGGGNEAGRDFLGVVWKPVRYERGVYNEIAFHPLGDVTTVKEIEHYSWPSVDWFDFSHLKEEIARLNKDKRYATIYICGGSFETPWYMRGLERFLMDLVECPDITEAICHHVTEFYKKRALRAIEQSDGQINIIGSGGDLGTQRGMMLSPELWRKYIKPWSEQLIRPFKDMGLKTFYHSCGSIVPVIEDFIEIGLDILDPIQVRAQGMDPEHLKEMFGDRLCFHGGVDEQHTLPFGTLKELRSEVIRRIEVLGREGGYILAPCHAIQADTSPENIMAMYDTALGYRY